MYKIMIADDEGIVIDSLKFVLEKEFGKECTIEFAKTGRSVIELAENFRPDIFVPISKSTSLFSVALPFAYEPNR